MKFSVNPLFIVTLCLLIIFDVFLLPLAIICGVIVHELSHTIVANYFGANASKITLMPFGARVTIDCKFLSRREKIAVLLAGSMGNLIVVVIMGCLLVVLPGWFIVIEYMIFANIFPALLNLLPIYPLDGGMILYEFQRGNTSLRSTSHICSSRIECFSSVIFLLIIILGIIMFNLMFIIFGAIMLASIFIKDGESSFGSKFICERKKTGRIVEVAVTSNMTILQCYKAMPVRAFCKFIITDKSNTSFYENQLEKFLMTRPLNTKIGEC